jgi:hypothetical protein
MQDDKLVNVALRGLPRSLEPFVQGICAREKLPYFHRLWTDCIQEETRLVSRDDLDGPVKSSIDKNQALAVHTKKGRRVLQTEEVHQEEYLLTREKHPQN